MFEEFFDHLLVFDGAAAIAYADLLAERTRAGRPIMPFDAAIARANGAAVATRNTADFEGCGIRLHDPWQDAVPGN